MKEFWSYPGQNLSNARKFLKKVKKCRRLSTYEQILDEYFSETRWVS
jgi:hypothetical protein